MTLTELKYCVELAKTRHFRKASENCFVSQPTLSVAIKKLEEELEVTLFERKKNEVVITPIGEKIVEMAEQILQQAKSIKDLAQDEHSEISELKIGAIYTIGPYLFPKIIENFQEKAPYVHLTIEENYTHELAKKLQSGELDVIIVAEPFNETNIEKLALYSEPFVAALPRNHKKKAQSRLNFDQLENENVLLLGAGHCFRDQVLEAYPKLAHSGYQSHSLQKTLEGSSLETIRYMVASGAGITILPCSATREQQNLLIYKPLDKPVPERDVIMVWRKTFPRTKLLEIVKEMVDNIDMRCNLEER